jgi:hypothetical protein
VPKYRAWGTGGGAGEKFEKIKKGEKERNGYADVNLQIKYILFAE